MTICLVLFLNKILLKEAWEHVMLCSHFLAIYRLFIFFFLEGRLIQLDFSAAFDRVSHRGLLNKMRSIGVGGQFLLIYRQKKE